MTNSRFRMLTYNYVINASIDTMEYKDHASEVYLFTILGVAIGLNSCLVLVFLAKRKMKKTHNMTFLNLIVTDLTYATAGLTALGEILLFKLPLEIRSSEFLSLDLKLI